MRLFNNMHYNKFFKGQYILERFRPIDQNQQFQKEN